MKEPKLLFLSIKKDCNSTRGIHMLDRGFIGRTTKREREREGGGLNPLNHKKKIPDHLLYSVFH